MYSYTYDTETGGILLNSSPTVFSKEPRPVYSREMDILGFDRFFEYEKQDDTPYMWAESATYWYRGTQVAKVKGGNLYEAPELIPERDENGDVLFGKTTGIRLEKIDLVEMCKRNTELMTVIEDVTVKRIVKEYEKFRKKLDIFHVAYSGGKDSAVLLDLVKKALPKDSFIVIFGDTGMEFPDTYEVVEKMKQQCEEDGTPFYISKSHFDPKDSWFMFGPPARVLRWCCSVHKSAPQTIKMREITGKNNYVGMDFVGVRAHESVTRSKYDYENFGKKQKGQYSFNPILEWTSAEVWLYLYMYFVNLKMFSDKIQNSYLQYVIYDTNNAEELKNKILIDIIGIPHTDKRFKEYYQNRKKLLKSFPESELAYFVSENQIDLEGEIYNYTDTTVLEKRQIVNWISNHGWSDLIPELYPQLGMYMKKYIFNCGSISDQLTEYFELYKLQKIQNRIEDRFLDLVDEYGKKYLYTKLPTRDSAINKIDDKQATYLYWVDALGVEYLSYIIGMANKRGLSVKVDITRADLPTITSINKSFYENWHGNLKYKEEDLDNTKHKEKGGFFYTQDKTPVHIIRELEIIEKAVDAAVSSLASHKCKQFVIASDHGASNLIDGGAQEKGHRAGTENVAAIVGMAVALEKNCMEMKANTEKILGLEQLLVNRLDTSGLDYIRNGVNQLPGNISLSFANAEGEMILHRMDLKKICISTGSACDSVNTQVSHVIKAIGVPEKYAKGTIRISFGKNNSEEEVLTIADTLIKILKV